ncbi:2-iminoacetate synthase ThiH [Sphingobacterium sp. 2149]|uniref:2-iminoacetate synthase ThiH n=1 Tax=Sphingobacterium sp. 2149 TaxID=2817763 RepID=UPI001AE11753|nr:2-iminoacetate synthase ThiH [Sphingobacterium sp. 2149]MDR6736200.1 2-iminoacetate synthase [Sphingobacterium sp. 2149]
MTDFKMLFNQYSWDEIQMQIYSTTDRDVQHVLNKDHLTLYDFGTLTAPAAAPYLEQMAQKTQQLTQRRFGKTIQLYAPLYLSNECQNICTYCGFSMDNKIRRKTLSDTELLLEAMALKSMGVNHILLVSGEANKTVEINYFLHAIQLLKSHFSQISIEVQPLEQSEYELLHAAGVYAILVYQETYHREVYKQYHPKGKKSNFDYRLDTPDRIGRAGIHKIGLGVLLGLEDWRVDSFFTTAHIAYLQKHYWQTRYSISFPRLRPAAGSVAPNFHLADRDLLQLICAYRLWNENLEISISTRENETFRDHIIPIGVTTMSAASKTNPGGYVVDPQALEQFEVSDERDMETIKNQIRKMGYSPVMKDWETNFAGIVR